MSLSVTRVMPHCVLSLALCFSLLLTSVSDVYAKATINIINNDGAGEGFNDATPATPVGGNTGTTLGQQRLIAVQYAADLIGQSIHSDVVINVSADFSSQGGGTFGAPLAFAGPNTVHIDFGAGDSGTWYVAPLANKLANIDLAGGAEITAGFNSDVDGGVVLGSTTWYYGLDANPGNDIDFVTVALHELLHGFGFISIVNLSSGQLFSGSPDSYSSNLNRLGGSPADFDSMNDSQRASAVVATGSLQWTGNQVSNELVSLTGGVNTRGPNQYVQMYAPNPVESGSSVSHFSTAVTPNNLMEPSYTNADHTLGIAAGLLSDIGWGNLADLNLDLTLTDTTIYSGVNTDVTLTLSNSGNETATGTFVDYTLPNNADYVSSSSDQGSCAVVTGNDSLIRCDLGDVSTSGMITITITINHTSTGNTAHTAETYANIVEQIVNDNSDSENVNVETTPVTTANAGIDQTVGSGTTVALDGGNSEGASLSYSWTQLGGEFVTLSNSTIANPQFTAPTSPQTLTFLLTVTDNLDIDSTDDVSIVVNAAPVADAGENQTVLISSSVTLDGTESTGAGLNYAWTQVSGSTAALSDANTQSATFTAPASAETMVFRLTVTDGFGVENSSDVTITVIEPLAANAGSDMTVAYSSLVTLDASASTGTGATFNWTQLSGSSVTITDATSETAQFTAPSVSGDLIFQVAVTDSSNSVETDTVTITVAAPPTADAGTNQNVVAGDLVVLDASASSGNALSYQWAQIDGSTVSLTNDNTNSAQFTAPTQGGNLTFELTVTDQLGLTDSSQVIISVNQAPIADAGIDQQVETEATVTLDGSGSNDPDGSISSFQWQVVDDSSITLTGASTASPSFLSPATATVIEVELTVTDNQGATATDSVRISVGGSAIAVAGDDEIVNFDDPVTLDGRSSADGAASTISSYQWEQQSGSTVSISNSTSALAQFTAPNTAGDLVFELTVTDSLGNTATDTITITVNDPPTAAISLSTLSNVPAGSPVYLLGTTSDDSDGSIVSYEWQIISGNNISLTNNSSALARFIAGTTGEEYIIRLTVEDNHGATAYSQITLVVGQGVVDTTNSADSGTTTDNETSTDTGAGNDDNDTTSTDAGSPINDTVEEINNDIQEVINDAIQQAEESGGGTLTHPFLFVLFSLFTLLMRHRDLMSGK